jgi:bacterial/archaeal transporter family-2 protein
MPPFLKVLGPMMLVVLSGACFAAQSAVNSRLQHALGSWMWATFFSYLGGVVVTCSMLIVARVQWPSTTELTSAPWWAWLGGLFGAVYVASLILNLPRLGAGPALAALVAGQMTLSLLIDRFGWFGASRHAVGPTQLGGVLCLVVGVLLVRTRT